MPSVSVIIPCYNVAAFLRGALNSVFSQGEVVSQVICVDDCSQDNTLSVLQEMKAYSPFPFLIIENKTNRGAAYSRNCGLEQATGDYIQFLDADDQLMNGKISHQLKLIDDPGSTPSFIAGDYFRVDSKKKKRTVHSFYEDPWLAVMKSRLGCTCSNLWHAETLRRIGGFDVTLGSSQEYDLMFRMLKDGGTILFDQLPLTIVNERASGSISAGNRSANWKRYVELRVRIINYLENNRESERESMNKLYQELFDAIRGWYGYDPAAASDAMQKYIPHWFRPSPSETTTRLYAFLYRIFGFSKTEKLRKLSGK